MRDLVVERPEGLFCEAGGFFIDPWRPVERAVITHAHADHATAGHTRYLASLESQHVLRARLGSISLQTLGWGERIEIGGVKVSLAPAGHVLGAAQVRLEHSGCTWVVSGDYRLEPDRSCTPFEPLRCEVFVTESTFALPIYRWAPQASVLAQVLRWWEGNACEGRASVLYCYSLGKAQRILAGLADVAANALPGPVVCHGAVESMNRAYRESGVALPATASADEVEAEALRRALVLAPPSAGGTAWARRFGDASDAFASGWMQLRGARRRRSVDRGFVLSDHADWPALLSAIDASGAARVIVTHGYETVMVRWLREHGLQAQSFATEYGVVDEDAQAREKSRGEVPDSP